MRKYPHPPGTDSRAVCRYSVLGIRVLQYVLVYLVLTGFFTPTMLVVLFSLYLSSRLSCRSTAITGLPACQKSTALTYGTCGSWLSPSCTTVASAPCSSSASLPRPFYGCSGSVS